MRLRALFLFACCTRMLRVCAGGGVTARAPCRNPSSLTDGMHGLITSAGSRRGKFQSLVVVSLILSTLVGPSVACATPTCVMASRRVLLHLVGGLGTSLRPIASIRARSSTRCAALGGQMLVAWTTTLMRQPGVDAAAVSIWGGQMAPEHALLSSAYGTCAGEAT